jgi:predicted ATPase
MGESPLSIAPTSFSVAGRRSPLIGRDKEMSFLAAALSDVHVQGRYRCVAVVGSAGIGKSRLVRDFLSKARDSVSSPPRVFRGAAREGDQGFGVFARLLRARFGIVEGMDAEAQKAQVRAQVSKVLEDRKVSDVCFFLGQLLELQFDDSPLIRALEDEPEERSRLSQVVLRRFLEADAGVGRADSPKEVTPPVVLVLEDMHHGSADAFGLLSYLLRSARAPILILVTGRPELLARTEIFSRGERVETLELPPLSDIDAARMAETLLEPCQDPAAIAELSEAACTVAGGNASLVEKMIRIFFDVGVLEVKDEFAEEETWLVRTERLSKVQLPLSVEDAVSARIAALSQEERELLERAALMGSVFWLGGLVALGRIDQASAELWQVASADITRASTLLADLVERDYVLRLPDSTFGGDEEYVFKHNLEREALSRLIPMALAKRYHKALSDWLSFKDNVRSHEEYLGMLARHREAAGLSSEAARAYISAGDVAREAYANGKAHDHYKRAFGLLDQGAEMDAETQLRVLHHHGHVLQVIGKNEDALASFRRMLDAAYKLDLQAKGGAAHSRIGRLYRENGRLDEARKHLEAALALFESAADERGIASTIDDLGKLHWLRGDYDRALESTQRGLAMRRKIGDRRSIALSLNNLALVYQDSGQYKAALDAFEQALFIRREIGDLLGVSMTLNNLGTVAQDQRDDARALELFLEALEVAKEAGDRNRLALVLSNVGETYTRLGNGAQAITFLRQAEEISEELGDKMGLGEALRGLGKAHLRERDYPKAKEAVSRAVEIFRKVQSKVQLGIALRTLGEVMSESDKAEEHIAARGHVLQSIWIFEEVKNDVELARSCRAYALMLERSPEYATDPSVIEEAKQFMDRAESTFAKLKLSTLGLEAFFSR